MPVLQITFDQLRARPWRRQNNLIRPYLEKVLAELPEPIDTRELTEAVAVEMGCDDNEEAVSWLAHVLMRRFARAGYATHDGEAFHAYGRTMRRWRWGPLKKEEAPEGASELPDWLRIS
jgi:hypothetical protein